MITIIITNYNSVHWLRIALHQIRKHTHIPYKIIISDQSPDKQPVLDEFGGKDITIVGMDARRSGYAIDYILKNVIIDTEYLCTIDVDAFPVHDEWLSFPIALLNEFGLTWVGLRAEIESYYIMNYGFKPYFHMAQCFRIGRTKDFKVLSEAIGFAYTDGKYDDAVRAHHWEDCNLHNKKLSLPVTGRIGLTYTEGEYGRVIGNLVMHFCLSFTSTLHEDRERAVGPDYLKWEEIIKSFPPEEAVDRIMKAVKYTNTLQKIQYWDGEKDSDVPQEILDKIRFLVPEDGKLIIPVFDILPKFNIKVRGVIHIGAHYGEEFHDYDRQGISNIIMFEPIGEVYNELRRRMPSWVVCYREALGNYNGTAIMFVDTTNAGMSSSILEPGVHKTQYPSINFEKKELVRIQRLDDINIDRIKYNMLNIDVQGYEMDVLKGAAETLRLVDVIYCEVNREEMYRGCAKVEEIDGFLHGYGFRRVETAWIGETWGDALYLKLQIN